MGTILLFFNNILSKNGALTLSPPLSWAIPLRKAELFNGQPSRLGPVEGNTALINRANWLATTTQLK